MVQVTIVDSNYNVDLLKEELEAVFTDWSWQPFSDNGVPSTNIIVNDGGVVEADITAVLSAHVNTALTTQQQIDQAKALVAQGKVYLQNQYLNPVSSLPTMYTTLSTTIASNVYLTQIMAKQIAVYQLETGFSLASITTNVDRARYIECVRRVVALLT